MLLSELTIHMTGELSKIYEPGEAAAITDWVAEHLTGIAKKDRRQHKDILLDADQVAASEQILSRLLTHEPVQYVLNESWFCGLKLYVDKNVLIPRPETEELVEWIIGHCKFPLDQLSILDIGSGSGCIPIALKRRLRKASVWGCDISAPALEIARNNASTLGTDVNFIQLDFLDLRARKELPRFDIIVSNPPYIPTGESSSLADNVINYEPATALFVPDDDPLLFYKEIAKFGKEKMNKGGSIYLEIHEKYGEPITQLYTAQGYKTTMKKDMQGKDRMLRAE